MPLKRNIQTVHQSTSNSFVNGMKNSETMKLNNLPLFLFMIFISITSFNVRSIFADETTTAPITTTTEPGNNHFSSFSLQSDSVSRESVALEMIWKEASGMNNFRYYIFCEER